MNAKDKKLRDIARSKARSLFPKRKPCFCGNPVTHAHHEDYNKPLNVIWLCRFHHIRFHELKRKFNVTAKNAKEVRHLVNKMHNKLFPF